MHEHEHLDFTSGLSPWLVVAALVGVAGLGVLVWFLVRNYWRRGNHLTANEEKTLPWEEENALALLRQNGAAMGQAEFAELLPISPDEIAQAMHALEEKGLVKRQWDAEKKEFMVSPA